MLFQDVSQELEHKKIAGPCSFVAMFTNRDNQTLCSGTLAHCSCSWEWPPWTPGWERTAFQGEDWCGFFWYDKNDFIFVRDAKLIIALAWTAQCMSSLGPLSVSFSRWMSGAEIAASRRGREQWQEECERELLLPSPVHTCCPPARAGRSRRCGAGTRGCCSPGTQAGLGAGGVWTAELLHCSAQEGTLLTRFWIPDYPC